MAKKKWGQLFSFCVTWYPSASGQIANIKSKLAFYFSSCVWLPVIFLLYFSFLNFSSLQRPSTFELFASEKKHRNFWDLTISEEKLFMSTSGLYGTRNICSTSDFDIIWRLILKTKYTYVDIYPILSYFILGVLSISSIL